jgi:hypothetical protein
LLDWSAWLGAQAAIPYFHYHPLSEFATWRIAAEINNEALLSINRELAIAQRACSSREAYEAFERAIRLATNADSPSLFAAFVRYLTDGCSRFKDTLLSCFADRDVPLTFEPLVDVIISIIKQEDRELARSGAIALAVGGQRSFNALNLALKELPTARRDDLERFLAFAAGL